MSFQLNDQQRAIAEAARKDADEMFAEIGLSLEEVKQASLNQTREVMRDILECETMQDFALSLAALYLCGATDIAEKVTGRTALSDAAARMAEWEEEES